MPNRVSGVMWWRVQIFALFLAMLTAASGVVAAVFIRRILMVFFLAAGEQSLSRVWNDTLCAMVFVLFCLTCGAILFRLLRWYNKLSTRL